MFEGLVGAIVGSFVTVLLQYLNTKNENRYKYSDLFAKTISEQRIKSINILRENISEILSILKVAIIRNKYTIQKMERLQKLISKTKSLLSINFEKDGNEFHFELENELIKLENEEFYKNKSESKDEFKSSVINIEKYSRLIFDYEWKRVKMEARGDANKF